MDPADRIAILAFDHRVAFTELVRGKRPDGTQYAAVVELKDAIYAGFRGAVERLGQSCRSGILIDEQFGASIAMRAIRDESLVAMPIERNGAGSFVLEYGRRYEEHVSAFSPHYAKALYRYGANGSPDPSIGELREAHDRIKALGIRFMLEVVPVDGPSVVPVAMRDLQRAGMAPDLWKVPTLPDGDWLKRVGDQAMRVDCLGVLALGGDVDLATCIRDMGAIGDTCGWRGFAAGRAVWQEPIRRYLTGEYDIEQASRLVGDRLTEVARAYGLETASLA